MSTYGLDLRVEHDRMSARRLWVLLSHLPQHSALMTALFLKQEEAKTKGPRLPGANVVSIEEFAQRARGMKKGV